MALYHTLGYSGSFLSLPLLSHSLYLLFSTISQCFRVVVLYLLPPLPLFSSSSSSSLLPLPLILPTRLISLSNACYTPSGLYGIVSLSPSPLPSVSRSLYIGPPPVTYTVRPRLDHLPRNSHWFLPLSLSRDRGRARAGRGARKEGRATSSRRVAPLFRLSGGRCTSVLPSVSSPSELRTSPSARRPRPSSHASPPARPPLLLLFVAAAERKAGRTGAGRGGRGRTQLSRQAKGKRSGNE